MTDQLLKTAIKDFLTDEGIQFQEKKENIIQINSPFISDNKWRLGILIENGNAFWNDFKARGNLGDDYKGTFPKFVKLLKGFDTYEDAWFYFYSNYFKIDNIKDIFNSWSIDNKEEIETTDSKLEKMPELSEVQKYDKYWQYLINDRCLKEEIIQNHKFFYSEDFQFYNRIIFPVYDITGQLVFATARDITGKSKIRWRKIKVTDTKFPIYNIEKNFTSAFIFEGIIDALKVPNGIAILGAHVDNQFKKQILSKGYSAIYLCFDNDIAGAKVTGFVYNLLSSKIDTYVFKWHLFPDYKDFGSMPLSLVDEIYLNRKKYFTKDLFEENVYKRLQK
jgi:hypothetical protein